MPPESPQQVYIRLKEQRESMGRTFGQVKHELDLDLRATLTRVAKGDTDGGNVRARLVIDRIVLMLGVDDRSDAALHYDSAGDRPGQGNPLADIMSHVAGAELSLMVSPAGELRELHGLDGRWRQADLLMVPPALLTAQWLFRDIGMGALVGEALFPPMPGGCVGQGDTWETDVPADIPLAARLNAHLRHDLKQLACDPAGGAGPTVRIESSGRIEPAGPVIRGASPAIQPTVRSSMVKITHNLGPQAGQLTQEHERTLEVLLTLKPPEGRQREEMVIRQSRTLIAERR